MSKLSFRPAAGCLQTFFISTTPLASTGIFETTNNIPHFVLGLVHEYRVEGLRVNVLKGLLPVLYYCPRARPSSSRGLPHASQPASLPNSSFLLSMPPNFFLITKKIPKG